MSTKLSAQISPKIGFVSHQNAVPILRELLIDNREGQAYQQLTLTLTASPAVLPPKSWLIAELAAGEQRLIEDRDLKLDADYLLALPENLQAEIKLTLSSADTVIAEADYPLQVLAKNCWGGEAMTELLSAFVMPNDPAIDKLLKMSSDILQQAGKDDAIDGYQAQSRSRTWLLTSALWSAVASLKLSYALPPAGFEKQGQKIRTPSAIVQNRVATCLDSALLFAAALEQMHLNPLLILNKQHAMVGVWLQPQEFATLITEEVASVRKRIELNELLVFETTLVTKIPAPSFSQAIESANQQLTDDDFEMAIDIRRARMQQIQPLAVLPTDKPAAAEAEPANAAITLEEAPLLPDFDVEVETTAATAPVSKLTLWQRKLLDLTTRNRLLHFPANARGIRLVNANPTELEDKLADSKKIRIVPLPDLQHGARDAELYQQRTQQDLQAQYADLALGKDEVLAQLDKPHLDRALLELYRRSRSDLDEMGANTLFLALGFLKWKKSAHDPRTYSAPLILLPIQLQRKTALSGFTMQMLDEDPQFNLTLLEMLRHDFSLSIPALEGELPSDDSGLDVEAIWNIVRKAVRDLPGFEVTTELVLGTFSFAKYLMWQDLVERSEQLMQNPLVNYLLQDQNSQQQTVLPKTEFIAPQNLDQTIKVEQMFLPLAVDSSQLAAVVASASGQDFVLDGPPGTGKSQTIANMIAHNLALGRRVLFVAEKKAALDVVYRRLEKKGLGDFCVELHSSKTSKIEFLKQLERAWDARETFSAQQWQEPAQQQQALRDKLNQLVQVLHKPWPNGMTVYQAMGRVIRDGKPNLPRLSWPAGTEHDVTTLNQMRDVVRRLALNQPTVQQYAALFMLIHCTEWSNQWQEQVVALAEQLPKSMTELQTAAQNLLTSANLPLQYHNLAELQQINQLVSLMLQSYGQDWRFLFAPNAGAITQQAKQALDLLQQLQQLQSQLSVKYQTAHLAAINLPQFNQDWQSAQDKFWILSNLAQKKVAQALASQGGTDAQPNVAQDLPILAQLQTVLTQLAPLNNSLQTVPNWQAEQTDLSKFKAAIAPAIALQQLLTQLVESAAELSQLRAAVSQWVVDGNDLLSAEGKLAGNLKQLQQALAAYQTVMAQFAELLNNPELNQAEFNAIADCAAAIEQNPRALKAWCDWSRVCAEAENLGLQPLVAAALTQSLSEAGMLILFETAYARWFAAGVIDAEPVLHNFVSTEQQSDIERFRELDDQLAKLAVKYIRRKLCSLIPAKNAVDKQSAFGTLKHELQKSRRHKPIRQLAAEMGEEMFKLAPCMLMSPLSIAQFLPVDQPLFDLVIFDEASQIAPWDAIGAIARGKQVVITGDPRQMPPTSFFNRGSSDNDDDDIDQDMESILDECLAAGVHNHSLSWHYRSRHESLIAFSNYRYYDSNLITFPAARTIASTVTWHKVDGLYAKGKGRHNQLEAEAIVAETVKRLTDPAFVKAGYSIGIITLNIEQQRLISDLLDKARQQHPQIEPFFQDDLEEPVVVKNLETVQGDERDVIIIGIGYGPTEAGATSMSMNFGPLNKEGGWRRLNVAITRAKREMLVFTSFDPTMIDLNRTSARAVQDLRKFIEFAQQGPQVLGQSVNKTVTGNESCFEDYVAQALCNKGWQVVPHIGVSRFRVDLGIVHPDSPQDYLVGIACDGKTYQAAPTAIDRDKVCHVVLNGLGWTLIRIWATDFWIDREGAVERLHQQIEAILAESRAVTKA